MIQGEREMAADNMSLGRFELIGVPPAPRGVPQIEVTFGIDTDGVTNVAAKDLGTGKSQSIRVTASSGLSDDEVDRLVDEAEGHAESDRDRRSMVELKNRASGLVYATERTLEEFAESIDEGDRNAIVKAVENAQNLLKEEADYEDIKAAIESLATVSYEMTEKLYAALGGEDG